MTISVESVVDELLEHWTPCTEIPSQLFGCPAESLSRTLEMFPLNLAIIFQICPGCLNTITGSFQSLEMFPLNLAIIFQMCPGV